VAVIGACITGLVAVGAVALAERLVLARRGELAR